MTKRDPWIFRLEKELKLLQAYCSQQDNISFAAYNPHPKLPPDEYQVDYRLKSIVGIDHLQNPIFGSSHTLQIKLPSTYPMFSGPVCQMMTPIWHPNIRHDGTHRGRVCVNTSAIGFWHTLDLLVIQIGEMLQYKNYHALMIPPYPEDLRVASWVREFAEPRQIVNKHEKIFTDYLDLRKSTPLNRKTQVIPPTGEEQSSEIKILPHATH